MEHTNTSLDDIQIDEQHEKAQEELNENNVQPLSIAPTIGMVFETVNEVKLFYRQYAISKGFGIRTRSSRKNNKNELCYFMMETMTDVPNTTLRNNIDVTLNTLYTTSNSIGPVSGVQSTGFMSLLTSLHNDMQNTQSSTTNIDNVF
ncbi:uncharacterized protein HKW66_Vig0118650 [Vigna angularis]|uniref:FAR1 domain-containing protein n=1 Tax=Phaseolus angularis TaxID=3914 RepID=A0A8T0JZS8_PHAAN|nr:uncharacterized protein HKW66_Vig0118650 [Vigna angularis]